MKRIQMFMDAEDWGYLERLGRKVGMSRAQLVREVVKVFVGTMRRALGNLESEEELSISRFTRVMLVELCNAMEEVSKIYEEPEEKQNRDKPAEQRANSLCT
jgi:hypothetical protein